MHRRSLRELELPKRRGEIVKEAWITFTNNVTVFMFLFENFRKVGKMKKGNRNNLFSLDDVDRPHFRIKTEHVILLFS